MLFKEFKSNLSELKKNKLSKEFARFTNFPKPIEYDLYYKELQKPLNYNLKDDTNINVRYYEPNHEPDTKYYVPWIIEEEPISTGMLSVQTSLDYKFNKHGYIFSEVKVVYLKERYIGKGIVPSLYAGLIDRGVNLVARDSQSEGARKMWKSFYGKPGISIWAVMGSFSNDGKFIDPLYITDNLTTTTRNPNELSAVIMTQDGVESTKSIYTRTKSMVSVLLMTKTGSKLDRHLSMMSSYEDFKDEKNLYFALQELLYTSNE